MLEILDVRKAFGAVQALDGMSLRVEPGTLHGFVGSNGAGKTTTMRIVVGIEAADTGQVRWQGEPIGRGLRIGYLPEERGLYPSMRVLPQLVFLGRLQGLDAGDAQRRASGLLDRVGLADRAQDPVEKLSLGNQQRVQLLAAMLAEPELLVLDEPFSGLDPVAVDVVAGVLREQVAAGAAVLFSSHQLELVERMCDTVTVVAAGQVRASGGVQDLRAAGPRRYLVETGSGTDRDGWVAAVPGATVEQRREDGALLVRLEDEVDDQQLLDAARRAGSVRAFGPYRPSLAELYREAIA